MVFRILAFVGKAQRLQLFEVNRFSWTETGLIASWCRKCGSGLKHAWLQKLREPFPYGLRLARRVDGSARQLSPMALIGQ